MGTLVILGTQGTPKDKMNTSDTGDTWTLGTSWTPRIPRQQVSPGTQGPAGDTMMVTWLLGTPATPRTPGTPEDKRATALGGQDYN